MPSGRSPPPAFRDHHPPHRIGPVRLRDQVLAQARQPCLQALRLDLGEARSVHTRSARIGAGQPIGMAQNVLAANLVVEHVEAKGRLRLRLAIELPLEGSGSSQVLRGSSPITFTSPSSKAHQKSGPFAPPAYPVSTLGPYPLYRHPTWPSPCATLRPLSSPTTGSPITRTTFPTCRAHYPGGSSGCACRLLPSSCSLPQMAGGSASALTLSRPARASHALRPAGSQPPKATFVARLRPDQLPSRAARQLPDLSTIIRVRSSLTDGSRLRGALPGTVMSICNKMR